MSLHHPRHRQPDPVQPPEPGEAVVPFFLAHQNVALIHTANILAIQMLTSTFCVLIFDAMQDLKSAVERTEKEKIARALKYFSGNITRTAAALDIARNTLLERMRRFGLKIKEN